MISTRLKTAREARGYTQRELASLCGFGEKQVWRYENGSDPSAEHLTILANVLEVSSDYLLGRVSTFDGIYVPDESLSPVERKLINAVRDGRLYEALKVFTELTDGDKKAFVAL